MMATATSVLLPLPWDSEHFGLTIARLGGTTFNPDVDEALRRDVTATGTELVYFLCDSGDTTSLLAAQAAGFVVVDVRMELSALTVTSRLPTTSGRGIRSATIDDWPQLRLMARDVHTATRFTADPHLAARAAAMYERWIERDLERGALALVGIDGDAPVGYVTGCADDREGWISLFGVDPAARGRGWGTALIAHAMEWFRSQRCDQVGVVTNAPAIAAQRAYAAAGFRPVRVGIWLHRWYG